MMNLNLYHIYRTAILQFGFTVSGGERVERRVSDVEAILMVPTIFLTVGCDTHQFGRKACPPGLVRRPCVCIVVGVAVRSVEWIV